MRILGLETPESLFSSEPETVKQLRNAERGAAGWKVRWACYFPGCLDVEVEKQRSESPFCLYLEGSFICRIQVSRGVLDRRVEVGDRMAFICKTESISWDQFRVLGWNLKQVLEVWEPFDCRIRVVISRSIFARLYFIKAAYSGHPIASTLE